MGRRLVFWLIAATILAGCGESSSRSSRSTAVGPHQGLLLKLPDDLGFAEVVVEVTGTPPRLASNVAAYFYGPDARLPLNPRPSSVAIRLYLAESKTTGEVALAPAEGSKADGEVAKFAAVPPPGFEGNIRTGRLTAKLGGRDVVLNF